MDMMSLLCLFLQDYKSTPMVHLGRKASLKIERLTDFGFFLDGENKGEILMPKRYITPQMKIGDYVDVFVFLDGEERIVATTETPYAQEGEFGSMRVNKVERVGAFLDWGVSKELLVPFNEQKIRMEEGRYYFVYVYLDKVTDRLAASMKIEKFLNKDKVPYKVGDQLKAYVWTKTELGYKCVTQDRFQGVLYSNEIFKPLRPGDKLTVFVKKVRDDGKLDLSIQPIGYKKIDTNAQKILDLLSKAHGKLPYNDKTDPEVIYKIFGFSKKVFKQAIGHLYKQRLIKITERGIEKVG
ncbi:MAG: RNA binding S1 domain-containing protein [Bacteroidetes bacterium OLB9]|nr:MAG: RNA binding S1 domain-containing protein [Bacteroidetes bacterium OLB9]